MSGPKLLTYRFLAITTFVAAIFLVSCGTDKPGDGDEYGVAVDDVDEYGKPTLGATG